MSAEKEGYVFTEVDGKLGHFNAFKLGEINVKVRRKTFVLPEISITCSYLKLSEILKSKFSTLIIRPNLLQKCNTNKYEK